MFFLRGIVVSLQLRTCHLLASWLHDRRFSAHKFRRQHPMGRHVLDSFCNEAKLNIELDGSQHGHPEHAQAYADRQSCLEERGIRVLRYWSGRLRWAKQVLRDAIWQALQERAPKPLPDYCWTGVVGSEAKEQNTPDD
jgi:ATP-dependent helicase HrpA/adenine-specific DNA-methyltransferase